MERSLRVRRGFRRLAIAGAAVAFCAAAVFDVRALRLHMSELAVHSPKGNLLFPSSMKDEEISSAMVAFAGAPKSQAAIGELPYYLAISWARSGRTSAVDDLKQAAYGWAIAGIVWTIFWLGLAWVITGFMT